MIASQFVQAGADELQRINFIFLNFLANQVKDTVHRNALPPLARARQSWTWIRNRLPISSNFSKITGLLWM